MYKITKIGQQGVGKVLAECFYNDGRINNEEFERIVSKYNKIILRYVKIYYLPGGDYRDMYQWGLIGLYKAVCHYDEARGSSFRLIAELNIKNTIKSAVTMHNRKKHYILNEAISLNTIVESSNTKSQLESQGVFNKNSSDDPADMIIEKETITKINGELANVLSRLEKRVIDLYIEGYKQREIAQKLNLQEKVVDNAVQRARKKMALHMKEWKSFCKKHKKPGTSGRVQTGLLCATV
ncbi:sigma-70 family RNA polymerase sigma factor [Sporomusa sphaeroides]|uniref:sigma-70 family RNA polymerase sigma factor n=1 Tax=Sporomusa sphaeroides TaxID=47679 RepID=UPI002B7A0A60|nr:sigma-70 family RNA polymerase sigma factor [Sporomusa sphaeroides]HML35504.1 sigma-70 family RNA polymerase sigma factor [Sporomusa sphaeroides]